MQSEWNIKFKFGKYKNGNNVFMLKNKSLTDNYVKMLNIIMLT